MPAANLLGAENHGFKLAMMTLDRTRPGVASMATGIARAALEFAAAYSKERVQFGVPIAMHQRGIEAEAAMLGQPMSMLIPQVLGVRLHGQLPEATPQPSTPASGRSQNAISSRASRSPRTTTSSSPRRRRKTTLALR